MADRGLVAAERVQPAGTLGLDRRDLRPAHDAGPDDPQRRGDEPHALTGREVQHTELAAQAQHGLEVLVVVDGQRAGHPRARQPDLVGGVEDVGDRARVADLDCRGAGTGGFEDAAVPEAQRDR